MDPITTPVAFFIFNRPDLTAEVFASIRKAKPTRLLVVADGPRSPSEAALCAAARKAALAVDWDCHLETELSDVNLGCKRRISSGLDWVFARCEEAIILEDDCLPAHSFFGFCQTLLERYRHDTRVMLISGSHLLPPGAAGKGRSYYFSRYGSIWGWASWKRAWSHFDVEMRSWPEFRSGRMMESVFPRRAEHRYWTAAFEAMYTRPIDTWDYQWFFARLSQSGLSIFPTVNLVSNRGFRTDGSHTQSHDSRIADLEMGEIGEIVHPPFVLPDDHADACLFRHIYAGPSRIRRLLGRVLSGIERVTRQGDGATSRQDHGAS